MSEHYFEALIEAECALIDADAKLKQAAEVYDRYKRRVEAHKEYLAVLDANPIDDHQPTTEQE